MTDAPKPIEITQTDGTTTATINTDLIKAELIAAGWTPPTDATRLLAKELDNRLLGHGEGDTSPVYVLIEQHGSMVIGVEKSTYDEAADAGDLPELFDDRPDDALDTTYTVLTAEQIAAARALRS